MGARSSPGKYAPPNSLGTLLLFNELTLFVSVCFGPSYSPQSFSALSDLFLLLVIVKRVIHRFLRMESSSNSLFQILFNYREYLVYIKFIALNIASIGKLL